MTLKISLLGPFDAEAEDAPVAIPSRRSRALDPGSDRILAARSDRTELSTDAPVAVDVWRDGDLPPAPRGPLLENVDLRSDPFEDWRRHQNAMILAWIPVALEAGIGAAAGAGDRDRTVALCDRLLDADPDAEPGAAPRAVMAEAEGVPAAAPGA